MALSKREKKLTIVAGVLVLPFVIWLVVGTFGGSTKLLRVQKAALLDEINDAKKIIRRGHEARERLDEWNQKSLPRDFKAAGSRYKFWLMELCESPRYDARFQNTQVKPMKDQAIGDVGQQLGFSVTGTASLEQLTRWLYGFYSSEYLHQIKSLTISPLEESKKLNLSIQVEALALNSAVGADDKPREQTLRELPEDAIDEEMLDKYCDTIADRALFSRYSPPPPPRPPEQPREEAPSRPLFDHGKFTRVTGITEINGRPTVWIRLMTSGKDFQLFEGETFEVGPIEAKVVAIQVDGRTITSEVDGKQYMIALGDNLRDATELKVDDGDDAEDTPSDAPPESTD